MFNRLGRLILSSFIHCSKKNVALYPMLKFLMPARHSLINKYSKTKFFRNSLFFARSIFVSLYLILLTNHALQSLISLMSFFSFSSSRNSAISLLNISYDFYLYILSLRSPKLASYIFLIHSSTLFLPLLLMKFYCSHPLSLRIFYRVVTINYLKDNF